MQKIACVCFMEKNKMLSRRDFLQVSMAASSLYGASGFGNWAKLAA